jgi:glycosyltransferase involved in cell wall biosynthesis
MTEEMRVIVASEERFDRTPDGKIWAQGSVGYQLWSQYLDVFNHVEVVARLRDIAGTPCNQYRADGENVSFTPLKYFIGPEQFLWNLREIKGVIRSAYSEESALIATLPGTIGALLLKQFEKRNHPYGIRVVGDPDTVFMTGSVRHPLRPVFRWWFTRNMKHYCEKACTTSYVTERVLQEKYPCRNNVFQISDVDLPREAFASGPRFGYRSGQTLTILFVGSMAQLYKAPDLLIDAVSACVGEGLDIQLIMIGDGKHKQDLMLRASSLSLGGKVEFLGQLLNSEVLSRLDDADLFVLPSRTEGLPRAMIEAMARGLPCIGSNIGGIPELLPPEDLVPPGDSHALARKIKEVATDDQRMVRMSIRNLEKAKMYRAEIMCERTLEFHKCLKDETMSWLMKRER